MKTCKVEGCESKSRCKGFCNIHYQRWIRGIPFEGNKRPTLIERIMSKVVVQDDGCWIWTGAVSGPKRHKYGAINIRGKVSRVHRVMFEHATGTTVGQKFVLHKCDVPRCVNPDHLFVGTHTDNMRDMIAKGRANHPNGEMNNSKLTEDQVISMFEDKANGMTPFDIGEKYGVHKQTVRNILSGKKWKHLGLA